MGVCLPPPSGLVSAGKYAAFELESPGIRSVCGQPQPTSARLWRESLLMADSHPLIGAGALIGARAVGQIRVVSITDKHQCSSLRTTATGITIGESATHFGEHRIVCTVLVPATMSRASTACAGSAAPVSLRTSALYP